MFNNSKKIIIITNDKQEKKDRPLFGLVTENVRKDDNHLNRNTRNGTDTKGTDNGDTPRFIFIILTSFPWESTQAHL